MPDPIIVTTSGPLGGEFTVNRKTILQVIQEACPFIGLPVPTAVYSSTERQHVELRVIANEMAERIAYDTHDWTKLKVLGTITGDGETEGFFLPTDYKRMLKTTQLWPNNNLNCPLTHETDTDQWLGMDTFGGPWTSGVWTLIGEQIFIKPAVADGDTVQFYYMSNQMVIDALDTFKAEFTADDDSFVLDSRVLRLGIIWLWKQLKGFSYAEDMASYEEALSYQIGNDKGSNIIKVGGRVTSSARVAYPRPLGP